MSAGFQPLGLEMGRVCLGEELHSRDGKGVTKNTDDEAEQANGFSIHRGEREV